MVENVPHDIEGNVKYCNHHVAHTEVGYEDIGNGVKSLVLVYYMTNLENKLYRRRRKLNSES